jgi:hypothetical protein
MELLYHRPIRYIVLHSSKICLNAFIFDVVKTVGCIVISSILKTLWILVFMFTCDEETEVLNWR